MLQKDIKPTENKLTTESGFYTLRQKYWKQYKRLE